MWKSLGMLFEKDSNAEVRESWEDYIPPYKNLGAIFIKAYHKKIETSLE
jgi:chaperonin cofactor prefoldin